MKLTSSKNNAMRAKIVKSAGPKPKAKNGSTSKGKGKDGMC